MSTFTVQQLIDRARSGPGLAGADVAEGALVTFIDDTQRTLLLRYGQHVDGLVSTSLEIAASVNGGIVGVDGTGTPFYITTTGTGYAVALDPTDGTPYIDLSQVVSIDPFGSAGGTPGFPLPTDFVKLILATAVWPDGRIGPVDIVPEMNRLARTRNGVPTCFVSGNRLIPVRMLESGNSGDAWAAVSKVQLSYVRWPVIIALSDALTLPMVLMDALIAATRSYLAQSIPSLSETQKQRYVTLADQAAAQLDEIGADVTGVATTNRVTFRR